MKSSLILLTLTASALATGCAGFQNGLVLDPVGPPNAQLTTPVAPSPAQGSLVVYSAYDAGADFNARDPDRPQYSDYQIFSSDGKWRQRVHNDSGTILQNPAQVALPVGTYRVVAHANGYGLVTVPVVIAANELTTLHLEGGGSWPDTAALNKTNAVRLPDGQIVGWRASK